MRIRCLPASFILVAVLGTLAPARAEAVTIRDIVELTKAGLSDDIIVALIEADRTMFTLDAKLVLQLREAGVTERVILVMVESRRKYAAVNIVNPIPPPQPPVVQVQPVVPERIVHVPVPVYIQSPVVVASEQTVRQTVRQTVVVESEVQPGRFINDGYAPRERHVVPLKSIWERVAVDPRDIWRAPDPKPAPPKQDRPPES